VCLLELATESPNWREADFYSHCLRVSTACTCVQMLTLVISQTVSVTLSYHLAGSRTVRITCTKAARHVQQQQQQQQWCREVPGAFMAQCWPYTTCPPLDQLSYQLCLCLALHFLSQVRVHALLGHRTTGERYLARCSSLQ
jgi:hypothetical protein